MGGRDAGATLRQLTLNLDKQCLLKDSAVTQPQGASTHRVLMHVCTPRVFQKDTGGANMRVVTHLSDSHTERLIHRVTHTPRSPAPPATDPSPNVQAAASLMHLSLTPHGAPYLCLPSHMLFHILHHTCCLVCCSHPPTPTGEIPACL